MSASPMARQACSQSQEIPTRKIRITDASEMPDVYASTPGGTLYSTTPGGTRIIYERSFMMNLRSSPLSQTPPKNIPNYLLRGQPHQSRSRAPAPVSKSPPKIDDSQEQFHLDL